MKCCPFLRGGVREIDEVWEHSMKKTFWKKCTVRGTAAALALALTFSLGAPLALAAQPEEPETAAAAQTQEVQETDRPTLLPETPELAAEDPEAPPAQATEAEENSVNQHTPENSVVLTPEQISEALDAGALNEAEAQCLDFGSENGFWTWLVNFLFGWLDKAEPVYSGWRTTGGKTYYYSSTTHEPVTGIQCIDDKLYYFDADGVLQKGKTFGVDVSKYQKNIDWEQIKKAGVSFVIVRIGYRGYGASGTLVLDPMFEEHFTNVKNAGLKVGVYFFSQATTEEEAKEEAFACAYVLNGRKLDYPIFFDTEASGASNGSGRADGLGMEDRTKCAIAFCEEVKAQGYKPGVYASTLWYRKRVNLNSLKKYTIWNAHYGVASSPIDCALWQGTCTARLPGYKGDLDVNISYIG
ncbi:glycosyl hydrolase family 25 [Faecalibacterium langellae]|uniref:Glycosyl hydrolase family 25 n=1 Tax=Faecalibacterium langellae TaxID=3435293 RepID=A0ACC9D0I0_9FIRM|nr:glycosyl hydrolase family 25 [Faecalibacterium prausnitzii]